MKTTRFLARMALIVFALFCLSASAQQTNHWVATWGTANFPAPGGNGQNVSNSEPGGDYGGSAGTTLREFVHISLGGERFRLVLSNEFGTSPLEVGGVSISVGRPNEAGNPVSVLFGGRPTVSIAAGSSLTSDPIDLRAAPLSTLAVSVFLPEKQEGPLTQHLYTSASNVAAPGNQLMNAILEQARPHPRWFYLKAVEVSAASSAAAVVTFGDSITDGVGSTTDANLRWTDDLARRLQANPATTTLSVVNKGIGGNRVLHNGVGPSAMSRFNRDVLTVPGVKFVIVLEGINDIGRGAGPVAEEDIITAGQLISAYADLIQRAHNAGLKIFGATLTPYQGAKYASPEGQQIRAAVNDFIRHSGKFDGFIDFAQAVEDPTDSLRYLPRFDHGDHLHPSDAGYKAMADSIDLSLFSDSGTTSHSPTTSMEQLQ